MKHLKILIALLFLKRAFLFASDWDSEYWQLVRFTNGKIGSFEFYTTAEARLHRGASTFYFLRATENLRYAALSFLDLEFHYSYIHHRPKGVHAFENTHRFEFECNPRFELSKSCLLLIRNRYELNKKENDPVWQNVLRQRILIKQELEGYGNLKAIGLSNELFYNVREHTFNQNRFVPLSLSFAICRHSSIDLFTELRNFKSSGKWRRSFVLGTNLVF